MICAHTLQVFCMKRNVLKYPETINRKMTFYILKVTN